MDFDFMHLVFIYLLYIFFQKDLFDSILNPIKRVLRDSGTKVSDVDEVILVGGSTLIPKVQQLVKEFFIGKVMINFACKILFEKCSSFTNRFNYYLYIVALHV